MCDSSPAQGPPQYPGFSPSGPQPRHNETSMEFFRENPSHSSGLRSPTVRACAAMHVQSGKTVCIALRSCALGRGFATSATHTCVDGASTTSGTTTALEVDLQNETGKKERPSGWSSSLRLLAWSLSCILIGSRWGEEFYAVSRWPNVLKQKFKRRLERANWNARISLAPVLRSGSEPFSAGLYWCLPPPLVKLRERLLLDRKAEQS